MNGLSTALEPTAWVLVHFVWQGALVALAVAGILGLLRVADARQRYSVACAGLALMAFLPLATAWYLSVSTVASPNAEAELSTLASQASSAPQGFLLAGSATRQGGDVVQWRQRAEVLLPWLAIAWLMGVVLVATVHIGGWHRIRRLRRETRPAPERWEQALRRLADQIGISRTVELLESTRIQVPLVLGWVRPVILVPASSFTGLSPQQLEAVLAHELAHIRRDDYLVNLLQIAIETLLFYHPAVWWVSRQVRVERENCCDDLAVELCGSPVIYARALADLEDLRYGTPALALGADGGSLLGRIRRLTGRAEEKPADSWLAAAVAALAATLVTTLGVSVLMMASSSNAMPAQDPVAQQETVEKSVYWDVEEAREAEEAWEAEESAWAADEQAWAADEQAWAAEEEAWESAREAEGEAQEAELEARESAREAEREAREAEREAREVAREAEHEAREVEHEAREVEREAREMARESEHEARETAREAEREAREADREAREAEREAREESEGHRSHRWNKGQWLAEEVEELRRSLQGTSQEGLSDGDLRKLVRSGIDEDDIRAYTEAGIGADSADDFLNLARHGVDGDDVQEITQAGYNNLTVEDVVKAARHGLDGDEIQEFAAAGYGNLSLEDMTRLVKHGLDGDDVREFQQSGFTDLTLDDLVNLARHGLDGDDVREFKEAGFSDLSVDDVVGLARHGLDGDDIGEFKNAGFDLNLEQLTTLSRHGVDGDDAQEYRDAGYADISVGEMVDLARHGVDGDDLQDLRDAGHNLSIEEVIRLARRGGLDGMTDD